MQKATRPCSDLTTIKPDTVVVPQREVPLSCDTMSQHNRRRLTILLVALLVVGGLPAVAGAQQAGSTGDGDSQFSSVVRVDAGETYEGSIDATAASVVIAGTVEGDVSASAGSVIVTESGRVTGSLDAAAGSVVIEGTVDGDASVGAAAFELREGSQVGGALEAGAADIRLDGAVDGDVTLSADTLVVGSTATVGGSLTYAGEDVTVADDASISGSVSQQDSVELSGPDTFGAGGGSSPLSDIPGWVGPLYGSLAELLLGAVLLAAAPTFSRRLVTTGTSRALRSAGTGLLSIVGVPILLLLTAITIVGIPLSLAGLVTFLLLLWVTSVYGALIVGTNALSLADYENRWAALLVGVVVVGLLEAIPVVGGLVQFVVLILGFGAFALAAYDYRRGGAETEPDDLTGVVGGE
jgi:cytoskeletal protein CcmA (bactofilin family)